MTDTDIADPAEARRAAQRHQIVARCHRQTSAGVTLNGAVYATDERAQSLVTGAVVGAMLAQQNQEPYATDWKRADGTWETLGAAGMTAVGLATLAHIKACYARQKELLGLLDTGNYTDDMLGLDWPQ